MRRNAPPTDRVFWDSVVDSPVSSEAVLWLIAECSKKLPRIEISVLTVVDSVSLAVTFLPMPLLPKGGKEIKIYDAWMAWMAIN